MGRRHGHAGGGIGARRTRAIGVVGRERDGEVFVVESGSHGSGTGLEQGMDTVT